MLRRDSFTIVIIIAFFIPFTIFQGTDSEYISHLQEQTVLATIPIGANVTKLSTLADKLVVLPADNLVDVLLSPSSWFGGGFSQWLPFQWSTPRWLSTNVTISTEGRLNPRVNATVGAQNGANITLLVMDEPNYRAWQTTGRAEMIYNSQNLGVHHFSFIPVTDGKYFLVMRKAQTSSAEDVVHLRTELSWQQFQLTNKTVETKQQVVQTERITTFSPQNLTRERIATIVLVMFGAVRPLRKFAVWLDKEIALRKSEPTERGAGIQ